MRCCISPPRACSARPRQIPASPPRANPASPLFAHFPGSWAVAPRIHGAPHEPPGASAACRPPGPSAGWRRLAVCACTPGETPPAPLRLSSSFPCYFHIEIFSENFRVDFLPFFWHYIICCASLDAREKFSGGVPKWPTGADCKSAGIAFLGSNPSPTTIFKPQFRLGFFFYPTRAPAHMCKRGSRYVRIKRQKQREDL